MKKSVSEFVPENELLLCPAKAVADKYDVPVAPGQVHPQPFQWDFMHLHLTLGAQEPKILFSESPNVPSGRSVSLDKFDSQRATSHLAEQ